MFIYITWYNVDVQWIYSVFQTDYCTSQSLSSGDQVAFIKLTFISHYENKIWKIKLIIFLEIFTFLIFISGLHITTHRQVCMKNIAWKKHCVCTWNKITLRLLIKCSKLRLLHTRFITSHSFGKIYFSTILCHISINRIKFQVGATQLVNRFRFQQSTDFKATFSANELPVLTLFGA